MSRVKGSVNTRLSSFISLHTHIFTFTHSHEQMVFAAVLINTYTPIRASTNGSRVKDIYKDTRERMGMRTAMGWRWGRRQRVKFENVLLQMLTSLQPSRAVTLSTSFKTNTTGPNNLCQLRCKLVTSVNFREDKARKRE